MPLDLEALLTLLPPELGPVLGHPPTAPGGRPSWLITVGRDRGMGVPLCTIFLPIPTEPPTSTAPPRNTSFSSWEEIPEAGRTLINRLRVPDQLWADSQGIVVLLLYLQNRRLLEGLPIPFTPLSPIEALYANVNWSALGIERPPIFNEFIAVLHRKLAKIVTQAQTGQNPTMVPPPTRVPTNATRQAPTQAPAQLCFMVASCAYQGGFVDRALADPSWAAGPADGSLQRLIDWRANASKPQPSMALLLGDQIYADATAGLFDPRSVDGRYVQPYLNAFSSRFFKQAFTGLPVHTLLDDHEIDNNFANLPTSSPHVIDNQAALANGRQGYVTYQQFCAPGNPPGINDAQRQQFNLLDDYFTEAGHPFLMLDTRTQRQPRQAINIDHADTQIISELQWSALEQVIQKHPGQSPLFIAMPSVVLPRRVSTEEDSPASALMSDAWDGFPSSLHRLLALLHTAQARYVVFLSGDEHLRFLSNITIARIGPHGHEEPVTVHSLHSSGLYAPYPFANGEEALLRGGDEFTFQFPMQVGNRYHCRVRTSFEPLGDGFAIAHTEPWPSADDAHPGWRLQVTFCGASGEHTLPIAEGP